MAVITISRQYGSGGREVAARVCEILRYRSFDRDLMAEVASEVGLAPQEIVDFAEDQHRVAGFLDRLLRRPQKVSQARVWTEDASGARNVEVADLDANRSIAMVRSVIEAAYKQGEIVIVGRGAQAVLKGVPGVLHVRLQAPLQDRILRVSDRDVITRDIAQDIIKERDRVAEDYLRTFYDVDWADQTLYHLVINTGLWNVEAAARIIVDALKYLPGDGAKS